MMLAAGDTFRAAAIEQLALWGERLGVEVIRQGQGADPGAVIYDATPRRQARKIDQLIIDTAGRLHTKDHLMAELSKIRRVIDREAPEWQKRTILVLDATTGQNALAQARTFRPSSDRRRPAGQDRRHGQGGHGGGHRPRAQAPRALPRRRREARGPGRFPPPGVRRCPRRLIGGDRYRQSAAGPPARRARPLPHLAQPDGRRRPGARRRDRRERLAPAGGRPARRGRGARARPGTGPAAPPSTSPWSPVPITGRTPPCADAVIARRCRPRGGLPWRSRSAGLRPRLREAAAGGDRGRIRDPGRRGGPPQPAVPDRRHPAAAPEVTLKWAMSLDGRIATSTGAAASGSPRPRAGAGALALREEHDAILAGSGTMLADDPRLDRRARPRRRTQPAGRAGPPSAHAARSRGSSRRGAGADLH